MKDEYELKVHPFWKRTEHVIIGFLKEEQSCGRLEHVSVGADPQSPLGLNITIKIPYRYHHGHEGVAWDIACQYVEKIRHVMWNFLDYPPERRTAWARLLVDDGVEEECADAELCSVSGPVALLPPERAP